MSRASPGRGAGGPPREVRIIGGAWKRSLLPVPAGEGLRPTPDRVRETLFNWLGQDMTGLNCLDLFAGTGALGFEAASRGAQRVVLVERAAPVVRQLRATVERLGATQVEIVPGDALQVAARMPTAAFDVIFLDPPFAADLLAPALREAARLLSASGAIYVEAGEPLRDAVLGVLAECGLMMIRQARAGAVHYHLLQFDEPKGDKGDPDA